MALRGAEAESVRFHERRVTKVGPEVKQGLLRVAGRARNPKKAAAGWQPNKEWTFQVAENAITGSVS